MVDVRKEPVNGVNGQVLVKRQINLTKPNQREHCTAKIFICKKSSGRGHFGKLTERISRIMKRRLFESLKSRMIRNDRY